MNKADVIVVPGSRLDKSGRPSPELSGRVKSAVYLYESGLAPRLLLCGGMPKQQLSEADIMAAIANKAGVPRKAIIVERHSRNTLENALFADKLFKNNNWKSAILTTDAYHMPRAKLAFKVLELVSIQCVAISPTNTPKQRLAWAYKALREFIAYPWYLLRVRHLIRRNKNCT